MTEDRHFALGTCRFIGISVQRKLFSADHSLGDAIGSNVDHRRVISYIELKTRKIGDLGNIDLDFKLAACRRSRGSVDSEDHFIRDRGCRKCSKGPGIFFLKTVACQVFDIGGDFSLIGGAVSEQGDRGEGSCITGRVI
jgi:hypothetical protein